MKQTFGGLSFVKKVFTSSSRTYRGGMELPQRFLSEKEKTFQYDESLPSAPIPPLSHTLAKYLDSVRPHLTDEEYFQTEFIVQQFGNGIGRTLQQKLLDRNKHCRNWLEQWWQDKAYLELRFPVAPLINITGPGPYYHSFWPPKDGTQIERAALVTWTLIKYWEQLRKEKIVIDRGSKTTLWDMSQYRRMFNTCKVPGVNKDKILCYFKTESEGVCPSHLTVICKGRIFKFDTLHQNGEMLTAPELQTQLQYIRDLCDKSPAVPGIGALTSETRPEWAKLREYLISSHPDHQQHLEDIQSSLLTVILDDTTPAPQDFNQVAYQGLCGDAEQRWFDKSVCMAFLKNGTVASNLDHSPFEGIVYILATYFCYLILEKADGKWLGPTEIKQIPKPVEVIFHLDQHIRESIQTAKSNYQKLTSNLEATVSVYHGYGKDFTKKHKLHPDTYVQIALQLAYYRIYKRPAPTYETASVRKFYHGRTETVRSCTVESVNWCKAMLDPTVSNTRKHQLFLEAVEKHNTLMSEAMELKGCDRHLFGLSIIANEEGIETPLLFKDKAFTKSGGGGNYILSTSFIGYYHSESILHGGCAPMCENGYGVFYTINPDKINFFISSWVSDAETHSTKLFSSLTQTLDEMKTLLENNAATVNKL